MKNILIKYDENEPVKVYIIGGQNFISDAPQDIIKKLADLLLQAYKEATDESI